MADDTDRHYELRELGVGGILDQAIRIVRDNFGKMLIVLVPLLAFNLVASVVGTAMQPVIDPGAPIEEQVAASDAALPRIIAVSVVAGIGGIVIGSWINASLMNFVAQKYLGNSITPGAALRRGWSRFGPLMWTSILVAVTVVFGFLLLIIPGIYFAFWYLLSQQVTVAENLSGWGAMKRSRALMKGSVNTAFLMLLVLGILGFVVGSGANLMGNPYLVTVTSVLLQGVLSLVSLTALVVLYFSCRCKTENFDLEHLAATLDQDGVAPVEAI